MWWEHPNYLYLMSQYIWIPLQEILLQRHSFSYRSWKIELLSNREIPPFFFTLSLQTKIAPIFFSPYRRNTHMILNRLNHPHTKHLYAMNPESSLNLPDKASFTIDLYNGLKMIFLMVRNTTPRAEWLSESERMRSQLSAGYQIYFLWQSDFFFRFLHFFSYL